MGELYRLDDYRTEPEPPEQERWRRQDEAIEQSFYQPPYPRLNLPGGNRWVRPYPASSTWPYLGWDDG